MFERFISALVFEQYCRVATTSKHHLFSSLNMLGKGQDTGKVTQTYRMIRTLASQCSPTVHFSEAHTTEKIRERISCQQAEFAKPLYIPHITPEGTMCLWWQVAIVHNVLMLTKCQFDPWDRWVGWGCGSWILKQATVWCSYGDSGRHDTDETGNYLPNGRQIQGREWEKQQEEGRRTYAGQMRGWVLHLKKTQRQILHLSFCGICHHRPLTLYLSQQHYICTSFRLQPVLCVWMHCDGWHFAS